MVDSEYSAGDYKSSFPDHLKIKSMYNYEVEKLAFVIRYVRDRYTTKKICKKAILENGGTTNVYYSCQ